MNKHCEGCIYKTIDERDHNFCEYEHILEQDFIDDTCNKSKSTAVEVLNKFKGDSDTHYSPACHVVLTYYDGRCPFKKTEYVNIQLADNSSEKWAISKNSPIPNNIYIETDKITLHHKELDIEFDLDDKKLQEAESITINGIKFIKEVK